MSATFPPDKPAPATSEWAGRGEQGSMPALRLMAWIALRLGRPAARLLLHPITLYYLCFAAQARRHSARYLARVLGRPPTFGDRYRHVHAFASTVLDRVYFVSGRMDAVDLKLVGAELIDQTLSEGRGAFLLGAHIGSFEALHAVGESRHALRVAMVMYPDNARMIHAVLKALAPSFPLGIIPIGRPGSTLAIRDWLDGGGLVGLLGDRHIGGEGTRGATLELPFLGRPARFSDGPLRLAMMLRRRVIFMVALYLGGRRYELRFVQMADFSRPPAAAAEREQLIAAALRDYVARLEALVHEAPTNWFNFFDFWAEDAPHDA